MAFDYTYKSADWGNWDDTAGDQLQQIGVWKNQLRQWGADTSQLDSIEAQMRKENQAWRSRQYGTAAEKAMNTRSRLFKGYQNLFSQYQQQQSQAQPTDVGNVIPPTTVAEGLGDYQGVGGMSQEDAMSLFGFDPSAAPPTNLPGDAGSANYTFDPNMLDRPTANVPQTTVGLPDTRFDGTVRNMGGVTLPGSTGPGAPGAAGPTAGSVDTNVFTAESVFNTGDAGLDGVLMSLVAGGVGESAVAGALEAYLSTTLGKDPNQLTVAEEAELEAITERATSIYKEIQSMGEADKATAGFAKGGGAFQTMTQRISEKAAEGIALTEKGYRVEKSAQKRGEISQAAAQSVQYVNAIRSGNMEQAKIILDARATDLNRNLSADEMSVKYGIMEENLELLRDTFTEDQRQSLVKEGYSEREISAMEQELQWRTAFETMRYAADHNLAVHNSNIKNRVMAGELEISQIVNTNNVAINERAQQLAETMGIWQAGASRDQSERLWKQMQLEYGLNLNKFAFDKWMETGQFSMDVLNADRAYNLDVSSQRDEWLTSQASLLVQERLGMTELQLRNVISGRTIDLERDKMWTMRLLEEMGFEHERAENAADRALERWKMDKKAEIEKAKKGSLFGRLLGTIVGAGIRVGAAYLTGGMSEVAAAAAAGSGANPGGYFGSNAFNLGG